MTALIVFFQGLVLSHGFFGSGHVLFGTDFPWGDTPKIIEDIKSLSIPEEEKRMTLGENAIGLLKME
jgi:predicted TIM-barrel fold metal-dependent hydrolase